MINRNSFGLNTLTLLQTALAADEYLTKEQFLLKNQTLNKEKSLLYQAETRRPTVYNTEGQNLDQG
jgi:hypothetical protein